jgi:heme/copper-type cytochrome/quinol oxidase subunit 3
MATVVELRPEALALERERETTSAIGMMVALGSWAMMFAALIFIYLALRAQSLSWPPPGLPPLPLMLPAASTAVMLASSVTLVRALADLRAGRRGPALAFMALTFVLGLAFVGLQLFLWHGLSSSGITTGTGVLGTVIYALTILHALHVVMGLLSLAYLLVAFVRGAPVGQRITTLRLCAMFWHFVDAVWVVMFVALFVL